MDNHQKAHHRTNPRLKANFFSKLFLCWMLPYLYYRRRQELKAEDIFELAPKNQSELLGNKLEKYWKIEQEEARRKQRKPTFLKVIINTFGCNYLKYTIFSVVATFTPMLLPLVLKLLMSHFERNSRTSMLEACSYVVLLMLTTMMHTLLQVHSKFLLLYIDGQLKTALSALIYRKLLRIQINAQCGSDRGKLITVLSNDVTRFEEAFTFLHVFFVFPITLFMNGFLLWRIFGATAIFMLLIIATQNIPYLVFSVSLITKLRKKVARRTDQRLLLMDEIIYGIRLIKMYTWEKPFEQITLLIRRKELDRVAKKLYFHAGLKDFFRYGSCISLYVTIAIMISYDDKVTSLIVFPLMYYNFDVNFQSGYAFARCLTSLADMKATMNRIQDFLLLEEVATFSKLCGCNNKNKVAISMKNVSISTPECESRTILKNISTSLSPNKLYALVGEVGSGKSSLLKVILGELKPKSGEILNNSDISFADQEPWLFNGTIRSNILLGAPFDDEKYKQVISSCALLKDFEQLPFGDKTIVGDRGAALSSGQSARINLARAVYRDAEVYLLDDPLASLDYYVGKFLFENCIKGVLKNKLRILVTQKLEYIEKVDEIMLMNNGQLEYKGNYTNFRKTNFFQYLLKTRELDTIATSDNVLKESHDSMYSSTNVDDTEDNETPESHESEEFLRDYKEVAQLKPYGEPEENIEQIKRGKIPLSVLKQFYNNKFLNVCVVMFLVLFHSCMGGFDYLVEVWSQNQDTYFASLNSSASSHFRTKQNFPDSQIKLFYIIGGLIVAMVFSSIIQLILFIKLHRASSERLHTKMISSLLRAAVQFFENNDSGRILNRFSQDLGVVDERLPLIVLELVKLIVIVLILIVQIVIASPYMSIVVIISLFLAFRVTIFFSKSIRSIKRLEARAKALVLSHSNATLNGLVTIRSFGAQATFQKAFNTHQDNYMAASFTNIDIFWSYSLWIEIFTNFFLVLAAFVLIFLKSTGITSAVVGYIMFQIHTTNARIKVVADFAAQYESLMTSTERTVEYTKLDQEEIVEDKCFRNSASTWPNKGQIQFEHLYLKYSNSVHPVLKNINVFIEPGTKVGIMGRTGAGKTSLAAALFRLADTEGSLLVDGVDIKTVKLKDLRRSMSILPQKSILFSTSLRNNLDPLKLFDDSEMWSALKSVQLGNIFHSLDEEIDQRSLSSGQRQLLCLARAILKKNKIFILDEPTANMDSRMDDLIYSTIKEHFKESTMLIIAHKLNSVIDCDKILVVDAGQVVEYDEPRVLLRRKNGYFYEIYQAFSHDLED